MVYLPMSWLYRRRVRARETPLLAAIRREIYAQPYETVDWPAARERVAGTDAYTPRTSYLRAANGVLGLWERFAPAGARARALDTVLDQIRREDQATSFLCIGTINKVLNTVVWHVARPGGPEVEAHQQRLTDYLWRAPDGLKMQGYNSSELWDTAFAVQGILATGQAERMRPSLERAAHYLESNQVLENVPEMEKGYRHRSRGGWPFSTRAHGWPISDCTAEGLKASLLLEKVGMNQVPRARLREAVEEILSLQNEDGGWATYELQRGPKWLEALNPSDVFSTIMVDVSYVECTSACVQALAAWRAFAPEDAGWLQGPIRRGERFIRKVQRPDGSWEGSWGVLQLRRLVRHRRAGRSRRAAGRPGAPARGGLPRGAAAAGRQLERDARVQPAAALGGRPARARGADLVGTALACSQRSARLRAGAAGCGLAPRAPERGRPLAGAAHYRCLQPDLRRSLRHLPAALPGVGPRRVRRRPGRGERTRRRFPASR
jgi:squalene/oxidosqualene cyclase-like protein